MSKQLDKFVNNRLTEQQEEIYLENLFTAYGHQKRRQELARGLANIGIIRQETEIKHPKITIFWRRIIPMAAAAVILISSFVIFNYYSNNVPDYMALTGEYLQEATTSRLEPPQQRSDNNNNSTTWNQAVENYQAQQYELAAQNIQAIINKKEAQAVHYFYLGLCHMYGVAPIDYNKIINNFKQARILDRALYEDEINWLLSLAYIKNNQLVLAKQELNNIIQLGRWKDKEAKKLLEQLNN